MDDATLEATLHRVTKRTGFGGAVVGVGTFGMGVIAALCGLFRVDPGMRRFGAGMWAGYGGMVCFFVVVGAAMVVSSVLIVPRKGAELVDRVMRRPETLARIWKEAEALLAAIAARAPGARVGPG